MCLEGATETWGKGVLADHNEDQRKNTVLFTERRQGLSMTKEGRRGRNRKCAAETNHCCFSCIPSPTTLKQGGRIMTTSLAYFHSFETLSDTLQLWKMNMFWFIQQPCSAHVAILTRQRQQLQAQKCERKETSGASNKDTRIRLTSVPARGEPGRCWQFYPR